MDENEKKWQQLWNELIMPALHRYNNDSRDVRKYRGWVVILAQCWENVLLQNVEVRQVESYTYIPKETSREFKVAYIFTEAMRPDMCLLYKNPDKKFDLYILLGDGDG